MEWVLFFERGFWFGMAAVGFAVLFNVPVRTLLAVFIMAAAGGLTRTLMLQYEANIIVSTLVGAMLIGVMSILFAHKKHAPPPVFAIPAVIPMVPGILAYKMTLGLLNLAGDLHQETYSQILSETVNNGLKVMLILMSLAGGVKVPMLLTRKESAKEIRFKKRL
ncbi:threonine/serine exporter family protein [Desertivirga xinjiangensis]|uniref:threonine/serine exporter family protein n=1 Tax=Desertivirga xinjiangensis TaxID=539206 RepID=UPI00210CC596|nr:threonine/serine exporter family protein [Pedobacter xinjiangensis]